MAQSEKGRGYEFFDLAMKNTNVATPRHIYRSSPNVPVLQYTIHM